MVHEFEQGGLTEMGSDPPLHQIEPILDSNQAEQPSETPCHPTPPPEGEMQAPKPKICTPEQEAWMQELYEKFVHYCQKTDYSRQRGEDIAHTIITRFLTSVPADIDSPKRLWGWLTVSARNEAINQSKRVYNRNLVSVDPAVLNDIEVSSLPDGETQFLEKEERYYNGLLIKCLFSALSPIQKITFRQLYLDGLSAKEAATDEGITLDALAARRYRTAEVFTTYIEEQDESIAKGQRLKRPGVKVTQLVRGLLAARAARKANGEVMPGDGEEKNAN